MIREIFNVHSRSALITGGSRGIGKVIAQGLATAGANPYIVCRNEDQGRNALAEILEGLPNTGGVFACDLTSRESTLNLVEDIKKKIGRVDILIHAAGVGSNEAVHEIKDGSWDSILELNLSSAMSLTRGLAPAMATEGWGRIIFISSIMGLASREERAGYSASKAGLIGFMKSAALELGPKGVTVNCIAPGPIETDLTLKLRESGVGEYYASRLAVRRWGKPSELIGPALLLASDAGSFITGSVLVVDGGALAQAI